MRVWKVLGKVLAGIAGVAVCLVLVRVLFGTADGERCRSRHECARLRGAVCAAGERGESYCTHTCESNADCPADWTCERAFRIENWQYSEHAICARPGAAPNHDMERAMMAPVDGDAGREVDAARGP